MSLAVAVVACAEPDEFQGLYEEPTPIPEGRDYAYKLDMFRFGEEVGGVVRFYEIEGEGEAQYNRPEAPYVVETDCRFFGPERLAGDTFVFSIEGPAAEEFIFQISSVDREDIQAELSRSFEDELQSRATFNMARTDTRADRACAPRTTAFDLLVEFPELTTEDAPNLALAVAFTGYRRIADDDQHVITRAGGIANAVSNSGDGRWATRERITFPDVPPQEGLTDPADGVQIAVGYLVLFDDGNGDGVFSHAVLGDEVLALSPSRVVLYIAGPPSALNPSIQAVFEEIGEARVGYGLYSVERDVQGDNAFIREALPLRSDLGIRLELVDEVNPRTFPALMPLTESE